jgi:hypothetical protein
VQDAEAKLANMVTNGKTQCAGEKSYAKGTAPLTTRDDGCHTTEK